MWMQLYTEFKEWMLLHPATNSDAAALQELQALRELHDMDQIDRISSVSCTQLFIQFSGKLLVHENSFER